MKIISNFKDYYDHTNYQFGYSTDVIFNRICSAERFTSPPWKKELGIETLEDKYNIPKIKYAGQKIAFCGKIYSFFYGRKKFEPNTLGFNELTIRFVDNPKDIEYAITENEYLKTIPVRYGQTDYAHTVRSNIRSVMAHLGIEKNHYFYEHKGCLDVVEDHKIFNILGCTSFVFSDSVESVYNQDEQQYIEYYTFSPRIVREKILTSRNDDNTFTLIRNPILEKFCFHRLIDPYTAIQEIEMYIGRIAINNTPPMPVGSDKVIAESKGFDEWSFRKPPTKKR